MGDNRPTVYQEGDNWIYRISGSGYCVRALAAMGNGYEPIRSKERGELLERSANEGNLHESAIRQTFIDQGYEAWGYDDPHNEVDIQVIPGVVARGHTDGLMAFKGEGEPPYRTPLKTKGKTRPHTDEVLLEAKTMSTKQFSKWLLNGFSKFEKYAYQVTWYMMAFPGRDVFYAVKRREDGMPDIRIIPHDQPPIPFNQAKAKLIRADMARRADRFPVCDSAEPYFCDFWNLHDEVEEVNQADEFEDFELELLAELAEKSVALKAIEDKGKEAEKKRKENNKKIMKLLKTASQVNPISKDGKAYRITKKGGGGTSLDKEALKLHLGDRYESFFKKYSYSYPIIRELEGEFGNKPEQGDK